MRVNLNHSINLLISNLNQLKSMMNSPLKEIGTNFQMLY